MRVAFSTIALGFLLFAQCFQVQSATSQEESASVNQHAAPGGVQILTDTQGVDFTSWLKDWHSETERTWKPLIPAEANQPKLEMGMAVIRFKVLPNGRIMNGGMVLEGRTGHAALDRAAWGAITGSNYPPLPADFHGPYIELRARFLYNLKTQAAN